MHQRLAERFWSRVVKGPGPRDCFIWTGAIADDGYGRFWIPADPETGEPAHVVRPHRFAWELVTGERLTRSEVIEHATCDNPICVRVEGSPSDHLLRSTQAANLARMGQRGRGGGNPFAWRFTSTDRASLAARSRRLRDAVKDGWDTEAIAEALCLVVDQPPLF